MFDAMEHMDALREAPTYVLEDVYSQLDVLENMVRAYRLLALAVLDEREVGREEGVGDTAIWLQRVARSTRGDARSQVEVAQALRQLPAVAAAACEGQLGREQLRETALGATPETDGAWANRAPGWTPSMLARARREHTLVTREEAVDRHRRRFVDWRFDAAAGMVHGRFSLPDTEGATLVHTLERMAEKAGPGHEGWQGVEQRRADALVALAAHEIAEDSDPDRATIVVHAPKGALRADSRVGGAYIEDGEIAIANETLRRIACDSRVQYLELGDDGIPIKLGRTQRTAPPHLRRVLRRRDRCCRWPGCAKTRGLRVHHLVFWEDGGPTDPENLALLCTVHHRMVHEEHWSISGDPGRPDGLTVHRPDGSVLRTRPPPLDDHLRERFVATV